MKGALPMTDLQRYLRAKPWWNSRFMWGLAVAHELVIDAVWHSRFSMSDIGDLDEALA